MSKYSVIIPCFNVTAYLKKCLDTVFENNTKVLEVVIVDDGSTDDFRGNIESYFDIKMENQITVFEYKNANVKIAQQKNSGVSAARNKGIEMATGEYILFVDPDDYISKHTINIIEKIISQEPKIDMLIMGFNKVQESQDGKCIKIEKKIPHTKYDSNSSKVIVDTVLPKYLGYSVENMKIWGAGGGYLPLQLEFGAVWRNVYNRKFLVENRICFNENIKLNEDSMFNVNCIAHASRIISSDACLYYYTMRPSGALLRNRGLSLVENKLYLLEERRKIVEYLNSRGFSKSVWDFAGSNVMSVIELMVKCSFSDRKKVNEYIKHPLVKKSIYIMPRIGIKKIDILVFTLKLGLSDLLFWGISLAKKIGIKLTI